MVFNNVDFETYFKHYPNAEGYFGKYGGCYISDELTKAMAEITEAYFTICKSSKFISELRRIRRDLSRGSDKKRTADCTLRKRGRPLV